MFNLNTSVSSFIYLSMTINVFTIHNNFAKSVIIACCINMSVRLVSLWFSVFALCHNVNGCFARPLAYTLIKYIHPHKLHFSIIHAHTLSLILTSLFEYDIHIITWHIPILQPHTLIQSFKSHPYARQYWAPQNHTREELSFYYGTKSWKFK